MLLHFPPPASNNEWKKQEEKRRKHQTRACTACKARRQKCIININDQPPCAYCKCKGLLCEFTLQAKRGPKGSDDNDGKRIRKKVEEEIKVDNNAVVEGMQ